MRRYRVTAPYVTATLSDESGGDSVRGFYQGGILPSNVKKESAEILLAKGMVEDFDSPAEVPPADPEPEPGKDAPPANPAPPQAATKADWVAFAVAQRAEGVSEADAQAEAEAKSKADLIAEFGS